MPCERRLVLRKSLLWHQPCSGGRRHSAREVGQAPSSPVGLVPAGASFISDIGRVHHHSAG